MCGDIDNDTANDDAIFTRFAGLCQTYGAVPAESATPLDEDLTEPAGRNAYMDRLFRDAMVRAVGDAAAAAEGSRVDAIAGQAIVFARLAGLLAAQLPPGADLFRAAMEAFVDGHGEPARREATRHRHHGHDHEH